MREIADILSGVRVVPVVTIDELSTAVPVARALCAGGLKFIEVVLRTPVALQAIAAIARDVPEIVVAAGTVLNATDFENSLAAGAACIISPGSTPLLLALARSRHVPYLPAIATAAELMQGLDAGYRLFKLFPASELGTGTLQAFSGPFPQASFCCNGGVTRENARDFLALRNVFAVGVSWLTPAAALAARDWGLIEKSAREVARI